MNSVHCSREIEFADDDWSSKTKTPSGSSTSNVMRSLTPYIARLDTHSGHCSLSCLPWYSGGRARR